MNFKTIALAGPTLIATVGGAVGPAAAASLDVKVEVPRQSSAEYHKPYVAMWIEGGEGPARTLAVWYDAKNREEGGKKWLAEMRSWWRKSGRNMSFPANGVTGATRAPGPQTISFAANHPALTNLAAGQYTLGVEAAREQGGQEAVRVPFSWPPKAVQTASGKGSTELGAVNLTIKP